MNDTQAPPFFEGGPPLLTIKYPTPLDKPPQNR